jgi:hypothetical protein
MTPFSSSTFLPRDRPPPSENPKSKIQNSSPGRAKKREMAKIDHGTPKDRTQTGRVAKGPMPAERTLATGQRTMGGRPWGVHSA